MITCNKTHCMPLGITSTQFTQDQTVYHRTTMFNTGNYIVLHAEQLLHE